MKKFTSSVVLCVALIGAISVIAGCGEKPAKETVWEQISYEKGSADNQYVCFHRDGHLYGAKYATIGGTVKLTSEDYGTYSINAAKKEIKRFGPDGKETASYEYTDENNTLILKKFNERPSPPPKKYLDATFKQLAHPNPNADEIKRAVP